MAAGFSSSALLFPYNPPKGNSGSSKHQAMNGGLTGWPIQNGTQLRLNDSSVALFSHDDIYNGRFWEAAAREGDGLAPFLQEQIRSFYATDPVGSPHDSAWERPPIENVFCAYGINLKTQLGARWKRGRYPDDWDTEEIYCEPNPHPKPSPN